MARLWRINQHGGGPVAGIVRAETEVEALAIWRSNLENYEDCYSTTGSQEIEPIPLDENVIFEMLRPF